MYITFWEFELWHFGKKKSVRAIWSLYRFFDLKLRERGQAMFCVSNRKRYGLAINLKEIKSQTDEIVTIPQAVWAGR